MKAGVFRRDFSKEVTLEQRLQGNKYRSHDSIWKSVLRGKSKYEGLWVGVCCPDMFEEQQGGQCTWHGVKMIGNEVREIVRAM